jgi:hypothetical protein
MKKRLFRWFASMLFVTLMSGNSYSDSIIILKNVPPELRPSVCKNYSNQLSKAIRSYQYQRGVALSKEGKFVRPEFKAKVRYVESLSKVMRNAGCKVNR